MRFGLVHRVMIDALAALGVLAVVSSASLGLWTDLALLVGLALALAIPDSWQSRPSLRHFVTIAPVVILVVQLGRLVTGHSWLEAAIEFAAFLQIVRLATRRGAAHDQQIIVLALLHFVGGTVLGGGLTYGICFIGFLIVAPGALVLSHLRREVEGNYRQGARDRTGLPVDVPRILRSRRVVGRGFLLATCLLSVPILLFTSALFLLFPRVGLSLLLLNHPHAGHMVGFSDHVDLGQVGVLRSDPSIALRFEVPDLPTPPPTRLTLRLRGTAFDDYDGRAWQRTQNERHTADRNGDVYRISRAPDSDHDRKIKFEVEPIDPPVIFLPPNAVALQVRSQSQAILGEPLEVQRGPEGELRYSGSDTRGLRYEVFVGGDKEIDASSVLPTDRSRYLSIPATMPQRVSDLAHTWADGFPTPETKAFAIEDHLRKDFRYDLGSPSGGTKHPVDDFLFVSKRGHCEFFSTAMALMLRAVNIPSRNVTGFVGGTFNRFGGYYAVREGDAHSWVEAYIDDPTRPGWRTFDPTPPAGAQPLEQNTGLLAYLGDVADALSQRWDTYIVRYDFRTQGRIFDDVVHGYEGFRARAGLDKGALGKLTRRPFAAGGSLLVALVAYGWWRRRKLRAHGRPRAAPDRPADQALKTAAALYRSLEIALASHGISRPPSLPPLRHAEDLRSGRHPLAVEVLSLTTLYLETRFGGRVLTASGKRDYERRVRELSNERLPAAKALP